MDGLSAEIPDAEKVAVATAVKRTGRASMSFSLVESRWLYETLLAVLTKNSHRLKELAGSPTGQSVIQKAQRLKYSAETPVEDGT